LEAAGQAGAPTELLSLESVEPIVAGALARWQQSGIAPVDAATLNALQFQVADLPGEAVSQTNGTVVTLDLDAAGRGWFVDATPLLDEEFSGTSYQSLVARDESAAGRLDLLTAIVHEMANVLDEPAAAAGFEATDTLTLATGTRRLPTPALPAFDPRDANHDGRITPLDALILINAINHGEAAGISVQALDVTGDQALTALDVLQVINHINSQAGRPAGEGEAEPVWSSWANESSGAATLDANQDDAFGSYLLDDFDEDEETFGLLLGILASDETDGLLDELAGDVSRLWR
jgi:hypothetical protein